ncbi:hypothetical protein K0U00_05475, partial [Paenibacillus sepulcri]|nr:hypothetical protein [Paenibacillus sepulcri]
GLGGAEAILFGMAGLTPKPDGALTVFPQPSQEGSISITGYRYRGQLIDVHMRPGYCKVVKDGVTTYEGAPAPCEI